MTKRIKRTKDFEICLQIKKEGFIPAPRDRQRNWLLSRALKEFSDELEHLHDVSQTFVPGSADENQFLDRTQRKLADPEIMEDWQIPIIKAMADIVTQSGGDILEIGFGRGVGAEFIQENSIRSHTVIECNDSIVGRFDAWRAQHTDRDIRLVHGLWQDVIDDLGEFDGIFFHTYPLNEIDFVEQVAQSCTFAEHFFPVAARHLKPGGLFSYLTNESDSLSRPHQRALLAWFREFSLSVIKDLEVPEDTKDAMWSDSMIIVRVVK